MFTLFLSFPAGNLLLVNVPNDVNANLVDVPMVKSQSVLFADSRVHHKFLFFQNRNEICIDCNQSSREIKIA